jgi:uncharacterized membrane protein
MITFKSGIALAANAALLAVAFTAAPAPALAKNSAKMVHCFGVNTCKGTSDCASYNHSCKGQNECKNQGFKELSAKACSKQGGSLTEVK